MEQNYFSVAISAYNASAFIGQTLDSVRAQTYDRYEVILVDDGSPECMRDTIEAYQKKYPDFPLRYVWQENEGPGGARKKGVEESQYEYVALLDHDDKWMPQKLEVMNRVINEVDADLYYHDERQVFSDGKSIPVDYRDLGEDALTDLILNGNCMSTSAVVLRRDFFLKSNPYSDRQRYGEDYECWIRLIKDGARVYHVKEQLAEYVRNEVSLTMVNEHYTREMNKRIVGFYDYLDPEKFSPEEIEKLKNNKKAENEYLMGRFHHNQKHFKQAREYYSKSIKMGNRDIRCRIAKLLTYFRITLYS